MAQGSQRLGSKAADRVEMRITAGKLDSSKANDRQEAWPSMGMQCPAKAHWQLMSWENHTAGIRRVEAVSLEH